MHVDPTNASKCGALLWRNSMVRRKDSVPEMQKCPLKMSEAILAVLRLTRKHAPKGLLQRTKGTGSYDV